MLLALMLALQSVDNKTDDIELEQYRECVTREAIRLEPSRETPETIIKGAEKLCQHTKIAFKRRKKAEWGPERSLTRQQYDEAIAAIVGMAERRAFDAAFLAILERRLARYTNK